AGKNLFLSFRGALHLCDEESLRVDHPQYDRDSSPQKKPLGMTKLKLRVLAPQRYQNKGYAAQSVFSMANAIPMPPLTQSVATPRLALRFNISCTSVTVMRVPVQPIGCPRAIAPPLTLSRSRSNCRSRSQASTWA